MLRQQIIKDEIVQKDAEGNGYSPLSRTDLACYEAESAARGEAYDDGDDEDGLRKPALILVPVG